MTASDDARQAIAGAIGNDDPEARQFFVEVAGRALNATMPDGRTIAQHLDDGAALEAEARELPHHGNIVGNHVSAECLDCGLAWPCPNERIRRLLSEARS